MEKTMKPWEVGGKISSSDKRPQGARSNSSRNTVEPTIYENMLPKLAVSARKRNPQRDAIQPSSNRPIVSTRSNDGTLRQIPELSQHLIGPINSPSHHSARRAPNNLKLIHHPRPFSSDAAALSTFNPEELLPGITSAGVDGNGPALPPPAYEVTEWTTFLDRIRNEPSSTTYEDFLLLEEVNGPGLPQSTRSIPRNDPNRPLNASVGQVEVLHRRTTKEGKAKLKLGLAGMRVDNCSICLTQFRDGERAALTYCNHSFHESCLQRWATRSPSCPVCRLTLTPD